MTQLDVKYRKLMLNFPGIVRKSVLTDPQIDMVNLVAGYHRAATAREIADCMNLSIATISGRLATLVDKGYLTRRDLGSTSGGSEYFYKVVPGLIDNAHEGVGNE